MDHIEKLIDLYPLKTVSTVLLIFLMDARTVLFLCFALLVVIDCLTRWTAISFKSLAERNGKATLAAALWGIPSARRKGLIKSFDMRKGMDKLLLYLLCTLAASSCDMIFGVLGTPAWMTSFIVGYMSVTEILSIIENLSEAGVGSFAQLADRLRKRFNGP
ncbi:phage holin family protein [uncultured Dialister sp.]|uniref:phage holin family protein n=1 Tax=uncultured Dialister sp. TaxID=278064 RepID=UPI00265964E3|nr:phage holin family protein [uncultured Dialister sp.]